jgi:hypothetical protein
VAKAQTGRRICGEKVRNIADSKYPPAKDSRVKRNLRL